MIIKKSHKEIDLDGKKIDVFDNVFSYEERFYLYTYALNSYFQLSRVSGTTPESSKYPASLQSEFSLKDILFSKILTNKTIKDYLKENNLRVYRAYINLCLPSDLYQYHIDGTSDGKTCLYYMNTDWLPEWEGETIFSLDRLNIDYSSSFIPGRLIFFDPTIPHKSSQPSHDAKYHRFVLVLKLVNSNSDLYSKSYDAFDFLYETDINLSDKEKDNIEYLYYHTKDIPHSGTTLFQHLTNTFYILKSMKADDHVCTAGLFHSVLGTDYYEVDFEIPESLLKDRIGDKAFFLVQSMCRQNRTSFILDNLDNCHDSVWKEMLQVFYANLIEQSYREHFNNQVLFEAKVRLDRLNYLDKKYDNS